MMNKPSQIDQSPNQAHIQLANVWLSKGKMDLASTYYQRVLNVDPACCAAYVGLGRVALFQGDRDAALGYFEKALALDPDDHIATAFHAAAQSVWERTDVDPLVEPAPTHNQTQHLARFPRKISLGKDIIVNYHRSGWKYALEALYPLHSPEGIFFDGFLEHSFAPSYRIKLRPAEKLEQIEQHGVSEPYAMEEDGVIPYQEPWVGFVHVPPNMPEDIPFYAQNSLQAMFAKPQWAQSLEHCVGLFNLSEYNARWLRQETGKPVSALIHPTEIPEVQFDMARFRQNQAKKIVQIGVWLRRLNALYELPLAKGNPLNYQKICLMPGQNQDHLHTLLAAERELIQAPTSASYLEFVDNTTELSFIPNDAYDKLLSENLVFLELYDSCANNAIVECIARATPILVNPLPPVVEYLGADYPFYFKSLSEAAQKALDLDLIEEAHNYLKTCPTRAKFDSRYFLESFANSEVYQLI